MSNYLVDKDYISKKYKNLILDDGYSFSPHVNSEKYIKVKKVMVVDRDMIDKILTAKFEKNFRRLVSLALNVLNDEDASEDGTEIVLGEVELIREILLNRYEKYMNYEKEQLFLKKLRIIENEVRMKQIKIKQKIMFMQMEEEMSRSRGR